MSPWEVLEHTADVGLRVRAETLEQALGDLVEGFGGLVCPEGDPEPAETRTLDVTAPTVEDLVVDALDEINFLHQTDRFIPAACTVQLSEADGAVHGRFEMKGEVYDPDLHGHLMEIKATTYHALEVAREPPGIEVIFDI